MFRERAVGVVTADERDAEQLVVPGKVLEGDDEQSYNILAVPLTSAGPPYPFVWFCLSSWLLTNEQRKPANE